MFKDEETEMEKDEKKRRNEPQPEESACNFETPLDL